MSILSGFRKQKRYATDEKGRHQLISTWTHTDTVYDDEGKSLTEIIEDLPAADKKVQQTATDSTNANYEILFSESADNVTKSEEARKSSRLLYNPGTKKLSLAGSKLEVTGSNNGTTEVGGGSMTISRNNNLMEPQLSIYNEHSGGEALLRSNNIQIRDDYTSPTKVMEIQQQDIVLTGDTWDGTNTSLKTALANAGAKVLYGTSAPTSVQGEDGQLYVQLKTLDPYLDNFVVDYSASTQGGIDTGLDISNLNECVIYIDQYQMVADVETLVGQYEEEVDFQNFSFLEITDDLGDVVLELGTSTGSDDLFVRKRNASDKFILSVVDTDVTADAIDKIYIKDNGEWLPDNDSTIPSPTSEDVDKVLGATDVGEYGWIDSIRFFDSGASAEVYTDHIGVSQAGYGGSSMTREQIQISNIMGSLIRMTSSDITLGGTWDGTNTSLKAAIAAASSGGTEAVYMTLEDYEDLTTAEKEDPTKIYFVIDEGTKVSPTLIADDGNVEASSYFNNGSDTRGFPWHAFDGSIDSGSSSKMTSWNPWGSTGTEWISYSFDQMHAFSKVRVYSSMWGNTTFSGKYYIEGSNDGTTWSNIMLQGEYINISMTGQPDNSDIDILLDSSKKFSKIRLRIVDDVVEQFGNSKLFAVQEFEIYATDVVSTPKIYYKDILYNPLIKELPNTVVADAGKALMVNSEGEWDKGNIPTGSEAVYKTLAEYEALPTADKEDPTKIYFVIDEGTKVSPTLAADDGNVAASSSKDGYYAWKAFSGSSRTDAQDWEYAWESWGQNNGEWISYTFSTTQIFSKVSVRTATMQVRTMNYYVEGSNDGTNWTNLIPNGIDHVSVYQPAYDWQSSSFNYVTTEILLDTTKGRFSKIRFRTDSSIAYPYSSDSFVVANFDIYAAAASNKPAIYYKDVLYTPDELPTTSTSDAGKILAVNADGLWDKGSIYRELTQAEYDALPSSKNSDGIIYFITDNS